MGTLWPDPPALRPKARCRRCGKPATTNRMINGYGSDCATLLGLTTATPRLRAQRQTGADLIALLTEPEDECDGWDR